MTRWLSPQRMKGGLEGWRGLVSTDSDLPLSLREFNSLFRLIFLTHFLKMPVRWDQSVAIGPNI
jgi:hypothetical protein